ncbi:MAG: hypothetical protein M1833_006130 [Piccolia ochrophora]|nr:MAG: hypothetical protein M1833_006130 [Piccolia ochrophora]
MPASNKIWIHEAAYWSTARTRFAYAYEHTSTSNTWPGFYVAIFVPFVTPVDAWLDGIRCAARGDQLRIDECWCQIEGPRVRCDVVAGVIPRNPYKLYEPAKVQIAWHSWMTLFEEPGRVELSLQHCHAWGRNWAETQSHMAAFQVKSVAQPELP